MLSFRNPIDHLLICYLDPVFPFAPSLHLESAILFVQVQVVLSKFSPDSPREVEKTNQLSPL